MSSWKSTCSCFSQRWIFTILASLGLCMQNLFSVIMSITIIEMVIPINHLDHQDDQSCESPYNNTSLTNKTSSAHHSLQNISVERYPWDEYTQGVILSSFSWSGTLAIFFYGTAAENFGGKHLLGFAVLAQALLTFMTPFAIDWGGSTALIIVRVLIGLGSDGMYPVISKMLPHWTTPAERTFIGNIVYAGPVIGLCIGTIVPAMIIKHSIAGWPNVFYFFGVLGSLWYPFWLLLVYETPEEHPFISDMEFNYLTNSLVEEKVKCKLPPAPWKEILTCKEFWAFTMVLAGCNGSYYLMLSDLPKYMGSVVKFSLESNAYFTALPYFIMWLNTNLSAWVSEKILEKQWMSLTNVRKLLATISTGGPGFFLLLASYAECDKLMVVIMFTIGITMVGSFYASTAMNPLDLSPNYAGSIMSVGCGIASTVSIIIPYLVGVLTPNSTLTEWRVVFWVVFIFGVVLNALYLIWFKADIKPWNDPNFNNRSKTNGCKVKNEVEMELMA